MYVMNHVHVLIVSFPTLLISLVNKAINSLVISSPPQLGVAGHQLLGSGTSSEEEISQAIKSLPRLDIETGLSAVRVTSM